MEQAANFLIEQGGILGVAVVALAAVIIYQNRKMERLHAEITELHTQINRLNELWRESEMKRSDRATDALNASAAVQAAITDKIKLGRGIQ